ncbi:MAG: hypothetical protein ABMB14_28180 [Myxococcota bacterium]
MATATADLYHPTDVTLARRSLPLIVGAMILTCGVYGLVIGYSHYRVIKELNPKALDPLVAMTLSALGYMFTGGIVSFGVDYWQWKCLADHAERQNLPRRNKGLFTFAIAARIGGLLSLWFAWTGIFGLLTMACAIWSTWLIQQELELYTDPA